MYSFFQTTISRSGNHGLLFSGLVLQLFWSFLLAPGVIEGGGCGIEGVPIIHYIALITIWMLGHPQGKWRMVVISNTMWHIDYFVYLRLAFYKLVFHEQAIDQTSLDCRTWIIYATFDACNFCIPVLIVPQRSLLSDICTAILLDLTWLW